MSFQTIPQPSSPHHPIPNSSWSPPSPCSAVQSHWAPGAWGTRARSSRDHQRPWRANAPPGSTEGATEELRRWKSLKEMMPFKKHIIPARDPKQCCGVFLLQIVDAKSVSGSLHQNPVVPLLQDVFVRISASAASRATCARSLYAGLLSKTSLSGSLRQDPVVGPLVQDHCMRISCARCLCQDLLSRIL